MNNAQQYIDDLFKNAAELKEKYEEHHQVKIEASAIKAAVELSSRYISDRHLPDKAIDLIDEACSKAKLGGFKLPENLMKLEALYQEFATEKEARIKAGEFAEAEKFCFG